MTTLYAPGNGAEHEVPEGAVADLVKKGWKKSKSSKAAVKAAEQEPTPVPKEKAK